MCESIAEGGYRCVTHARTNCEKCEREYRAVYPDGPDSDALARATELVQISRAESAENSVADAWDMFDQIELTQDSDGNHVVRARMLYDYFYLVPNHARPDERDMAEWLEENRNEIEAFLEDRFGAQIGRTDDWLEGTIDVVLPTRQGASLESSMRVTEGALALYNSLTCKDGARPVCEQFREHIQRREEEVEEAVGAFKAAALRAESFEGRQFDEAYDTDGLAPQTVSQMVSDVREFTLANRHLIAQAQKVAEEQGRSFTMADVGHNYLLSRNGHGTGFWDCGLGDVGDALHAAAKSSGPFEMYVRDDEKVYA